MKYSTQLLKTFSNGLYMYATHWKLKFEFPNFRKILQNFTEMKCGDVHKTQMNLPSIMFFKIIHYLYGKN